MGRYHQKIEPTHVELDNDLKKVGQGGVRGALNGRRGSSTMQSMQTWENIRSTLEVPFALPEGRNKGLCAVEDIKNNRIIYANWNSKGNHAWYCYLGSENIIVPLYLDSVNDKILDFDEFHHMRGTRTALIEGTHFFWTDKYKAPRYMNIDWALDHGKKKIWELSLFSLTRTVGNDIFSLKVNGVPVIVFDASNANATLLNANPILNTYFDIDVSDSKIIFTEKIPNTCSLSLVNNIVERLVAANFYMTPHTERQLDMIMYPHSTAPTAYLKVNTKIRRNNLKGFTWQFRVRRKYKYSGYTTWSPWSKLVSTADECSRVYNYIQVDYSAKIFDEYRNLPDFQLLEAVEIGYRNTNEGELHKCITIMQHEVPKDVQVYDFYNDTHADVRGKEENEKHYDNVPLSCGALNVVRDRIVCSNIVEDYDVGNFDFDCEVKYHNKNDTGLNTGIGATIVIPIRIRGSHWANTFQPVWKPNGASYPLFGGYFPYMVGGFEGSFNKDAAEGMGQQLPAGGFPVYIAGTNYIAISKQNLINGIGVAEAEHTVYNTNGLKPYIVNNNGSIPAQNILLYSKATFTGIPDGTHIIRVASHLCSYGDVLGKGADFYDLGNGINYQKTSTNINKIGTRTDVKEIVVTVFNGAVVSVYLGAVYAGTTIPEIEISDYTDLTDAASTGDSAVSLIQGYFIDGITDSQPDLKAGNKVEGSKIEHWRRHLVGNCGHTDEYYEAYTDHNGYSHARVTTGGAVDRRYKFRIRKPLTTDAVFLSDTDRFWKGNLSTLNAEACDSDTSCDFKASKLQNYNMIFPRQRGADIIKTCRTLLKGRVVGAGGLPIANARVMVTGTSRFDYTDINGNFSILVYSNNTDDRIGKLIISGSNCYAVNKVVDFVILMGANRYNDTHPYNFGDINTGITFDGYTQRFYLKSGGVCDFGMSLADRGNRMSAIVFDETKHRIRTPFITEKVQDYYPNITVDESGNPVDANTKAEGYFTVTIKLKTKPPKWCTHLYVNRTEDQVYADWIQMVVSDVLYVENYATTVDNDGITVGDPNIVTFGSNTASEIYLDLQTSFYEYKNRNSDSQLGWSFGQGDRLRFIYDKAGGVRDFVEVEIKQQRGNYFVIPYIELFGEIFSGEVVEVFRIKTKRENQLFYEIGEYARVKDRYTETRSWELTSIILNTGDAYRRNRTMYASFTRDNSSGFSVVTRMIEDSSPSDTYSGKDNDIGRVNAVDIKYRQLFKGAAHRFGGRYLKGSNRNELRTYDALDIVEDNSTFGEVTVVDDYGGVMFVAQKHRCHVRYINKSIAMEGGEQILLDSKRFLSEPDPLDFDGGCSHVESYARHKNSGKFYDSYRGSLNQYSIQDGVINISGYNRYNKSRQWDKYFNEIGDVMKKIPTTVIDILTSMVGGYSPHYNEYYISTFPIDIKKDANYGFLNPSGQGANIGDNDEQFKKYDTIIQNSDILLTGDTAVYDDIENFWIGNRGYIPEVFVKFGEDYISLKDGKFYIMEKGADCMVFYGIDQKQRLILISNINPSEMKDHLCWSQEGSHKWSNPSNEIPMNSLIGRTQKSRTPDSKISGRNRVWDAPFLKDETTLGVEYPLLNGADMVGEVMLITIENNYKVPVQLYCVNIYSQYVGRSNF